MVLAFLTFRLAECMFLMKNIFILAIQCQIYVLYKIFPFPFLMTVYDVLEKLLYMEAQKDDDNEKGSSEEEDDDEEKNEDEDSENK
ncbi:hypothetical protein WA026_007364 [Henosepilachna vigintioctopunctata]|uniref:Uncharacterized protein n=1 Tax=Henosepilachna vigintioctopunctata TaxID=420089 RepID=A0AAW1UX17_9CUCU